MVEVATPHASKEDAQQRFRRLAAEWKAKSRHLSNTAQMAMLDPYQRIIGMGWDAVPLILEELRREPDQWFWALEKITDENPVPPEAAGRVEQMAAAWIDWGIRERSHRAMTLYDLFPRLTPHNHRATSPETTAYNCVAWAVGDVEHWWWPGDFWPVPLPPGEYGLAVLAQVFQTLGFEDCQKDRSLELGFEKVALDGNNLLFTHAARQLPSGKWTSKLGSLADIEHDTPDVIGGSDYGEAVQIMKRPAKTP